MAISDTVKTWVVGNDFFAGNRVEQGRDVFVPDNKKYPHVHIGSNFVTYSKSSGNHMYLSMGSEAYASRIRNAYHDSREAHIMQICRYMESQFCD